MLYPALATGSFVSIWLAFLLRFGNKRRHALLAGIGIATDLGLVLTLELTRNAVLTALGNELNTWQRVHVGASTVAVALYFPVFVLGWRRLFHPAASAKLRVWHRRLGYAALTFRTIGFVFMFSMLSRTTG